MHRSVYLAILFSVGCYFPTSIGGVPSRLLMILGFVISICAIAYGLQRYGAAEKAIIYCCLPIVIILCFFTIFGGLNVIRLGNLAVFVAAGLMFSMRIRCDREVWAQRLLIAISIVNVALGVAMILHWAAACDFLIAIYNDKYQELLPLMIASHKPVLTYATHSLAGFFVYMFFWLNLRAFEQTRQKIHVGLAILHALLCVSLFSHTSFVFSVAAFCELIWLGWKNARLNTIVCVAIVISLTPACIRLLLPEASSFDDVKELLTVMWTEGSSGIAGRYGIGGDLRPTWAYITAHPFSGIGVSTSPQYIEDDSGPLTYLLSGSLPLLTLMYGGLWFFLRRNLELRTCVHLYICILLTEAGYAVLLYQRSLCLLPAFVLLLSTFDVKARKVYVCA